MGNERDEGEMKTLAWAAVVGRLNDSMLFETAAGAGRDGTRRKKEQTRTNDRPTTNQSVFCVCKCLDIRDTGTEMRFRDLSRKFVVLVKRNLLFCCGAAD